MYYWQESRTNSLKSIFAVFWWNVVVPRGKQTSPRPNLAPGLDMCSPSLKSTVFFSVFAFSLAPSAAPILRLRDSPPSPCLFREMWRTAHRAARKTVRAGAKIHTPPSPIKPSNSSMPRSPFLRLVCRTPLRPNSQDLLKSHRHNLFLQI